MKQRNKSAKTQTHNKPEQPASQPKPPTPTADQIRRRAQEIFEARGSAPGCEPEDWLQAEIELKSAIGLQDGNTAN